ncbi:MAG: rhomboid family intramembrane serine protease [Sandaracinaceae bacterium]
MILLPYGHDQSVYGKQWATYGLIALNLLVFLYTWASGFGMDDELSHRMSDVEAVLIAYPDAHIDAALLEDTPAGIRAVLGDLVEPDPDSPLTEGDLALENATADLLDTFRALPEQRLGYRPGDPSALTALSSLFVHGGFWHLFGNMLFLWLAGAVIECFWDRGLFLGVYFLAGLGATAAQHLAEPDSLVPIIGASGAISGLLGAFVVGYPKTRVRMFWAAIPFGFGHFYVRAWLLIPLWAGIQLFYALLAFEDGVAHWAHLGGFAVGVVSAIVVKRMDWDIADAGDGSSG